MNNKKNKKSSSVFKIIGLILGILFLISLSIFSYFIFKINIIPTKYLLVFYGVTLLITIVFLIIFFLNFNRILKTICLVLMIIGFIGISIVNYYLNNTYNFLVGTQSKYDTLTYSVLVRSDSKYNKFNDLENRTISYINDNYQEEIKQKIPFNFTQKTSGDFITISKWLLNNYVDSIVLEESYLELAREEVEGFSDNTKVIYTFDIRIDSYKSDTSDIDVSSDSFILYISGIDQYGNVNSVRGRSDVNMLAIVNPRTNHILLVNTPRDYYVQLYGTTGLKDKLTHAGIYGIDKSIKTIESIYNIKIDHYLRVNFNTLVKVVDVIGGIDIDSDKAFTPWTDKELHIEKGINHMNGRMALAYARERKTYLTGDHHRGENQQQVITAIINKISTSSTLLKKYNSILNTLDGSFQTDMSISMITGFIKNQLNEMSSWKVDSIASYGYNSYNYTYSMGYNYYLYVMEPDWDSVNMCKNKINEVFNEN